MKRRPAILLATAILLNLLLFGVIAGFYGGLSATPYGTQDSAGRTMGFNDYFSREHYRIILGNITVAGLFRETGAYGTLFLGANALGLLLLRQVLGKWRSWAGWFFAGQTLLFPFGWFALLYQPVAIPWVIVEAMGENLTRESFVDNPPLWAVCHGFWLIIATVTVFKLLSSRRQNLPEPPGSPSTCEVCGLG